MSSPVNHNICACVLYSGFISVFLLACQCFSRQCILCSCASFQINTGKCSTASLFLHVELIQSLQCCEGNCSWVSLKQHLKKLFEQIQSFGGLRWPDLLQKKDQGHLRFICFIHLEKNTLLTYLKFFYTLISYATSVVSIGTLFKVYNH